jgi:hypothetical protein
MVLTVSFVLSPVTGFLVTVAPKKRWLPENLTPASGRQDHTTSPYASASLVRAPQARTTLPRPSHPASRFVTIAHTPLW